MFHCCRQFILNDLLVEISASWRRYALVLEIMNIRAEICPDSFFKATNQSLFSVCLLVYMHISCLHFCLPYCHSTLSIWMCWNLLLFLFHLIMTFTFLQILLLRKLCSAVCSSRLFQPCCRWACTFQTLTCALSCPCCPRKSHSSRKATTVRHSCFSPFMTLQQWYLL